VEFKQGVTQVAIDTALGAIGGNGKRLENAGVGTIKFGSRGQSDARKALAQLGNLIQRCEDDQVVKTDPRDAVSSAGTQSPASSWGLDRTDQRALPLNNSYSYATTGSGVDVYVVDTGVLSTHSEFTGRIRSGFAATGLTGTEDCNGHGTHVAGTAAGATYGIAPAATVVPVRVLDCNGSGTLSGVIAGIDWAIQDHTTTPAVLNMSLGGGLSGILDAAVQRAVDDGISVVVAAGNSTQDACGFSPAAAPNAITVGSTTTSDTRSLFSNFGECVDVFAPGSAIKSAWHTSTTATNTISGTSMASPHVAGVAARILSANPTFSPGQVAAIIKSSATPNVVLDSRSTSNLLLFADADATTVTPPPTDGGGTTPGDGTQASAPETPNTPVALAGDRSVRLQWTNNADGGSAIIGHSVRVFANSNLISELSVNARTDITISGLKVGTVYTFRVATINGVGRSAFSALSNEATPVRIVGNKAPKVRQVSAPDEKAGVPRALRVTTSGSRLITSWRYAKQDLEHNTNFIVLIRDEDGVAARLVVSDWQGVTVAGLDPGRYTVRVRAFNTMGAARATPPVSVRIR
jgi:subtilisin family serine protease